MNKKSVNSKLVDKVLQDTMLLQKLSNIVYELLLEDLRNQRDRSGSYRI